MSVKQIKFAAQERRCCNIGAETTKLLYQCGVTRMHANEMAKSALVGWFTKSSPSASSFWHDDEGFIGRQLAMLRFCRRRMRLTLVQCFIKVYGLLTQYLSYSTSLLNFKTT
jgi:hypothetical protein